MMIFSGDHAPVWSPYLVDAPASSLCLYFFFFMSVDTLFPEKEKRRTLMRPLENDYAGA